MVHVRSSPYDWRFPVADPSLFAGRSDELSIVEKEIARLTSASPIPPVIAVIGERRVGKTSLLTRIKEICEGYSLVNVCVSIEDHMVDDTWEFWHEVFSKLLIHTREKGALISGGDRVGIGFGFLTPQQHAETQTRPVVLKAEDLWFSNAYGKRLSEQISENPASYLIQHELNMISKCFLQLNCKGMLLMFDEAHKLLPSREIMQQIRHAVHQTERCGLVFAGETEATRMFSEPSEPFFGQVSVVPLRNFTSYDDIAACALLPLTEEEHPLMSPMTIDHIARLSQGKPNQIRLICDAIYSRYANGNQDDLNITIDVLDDVADKVAEFYQDEQLKGRIDNIMKLNSVDLEILYNMTRYPNWLIEDIINLDEAFRGESKCDLAYARRKRQVVEKQEHFTSMGLIASDQDRCKLEGGEFIHLYLRFLYEVRKYGKLLKKLVLGKGPPTPFGEKTEKLARSIAYTLGRSPELMRYAVHSYYRDEGDIVETIRHRFTIFTKLMEGMHPRTKDIEEIVTECFRICQLIGKPGEFYMLCISVRNLDNPRESTHVELYFPTEEEQGKIDVTSLMKLVKQQADDARISLEAYGDMIVRLPSLKDLVDRITGTTLDNLLPKLDMVDRWKLMSVQHIVDSERDHDEDEEDEDEKYPKWLKLHASADDKAAVEYLFAKFAKTQKRNKRAWLANDLGYLRCGLVPIQLDNARRDLDRAISLHYSNIPLTLLNLSVIDIDEGKYKDAISRIEDVLLLTSSRLDIDAAYLRLRLPESPQGFRVKWEQHPANILEAAYINLAYAVLNENGYSDAYDILQEGLRLLPSSARLKHALARLLLFNKRADLALPYYQELSQLPSLPDKGIAQEIKIFSRRLRKSPRGRK